MIELEPGSTALSTSRPTSTTTTAASAGSSPSPRTARSFTTWSTTRSAAPGVLQPARRAPYNVVLEAEDHANHVVQDKLTIFVKSADAEPTGERERRRRRIEADTIRSYFKPGPSGRLDSVQIDDGLKALIETGLFQDVKINQAGGRLVVVVVENPVINRVVFEGNKKVKDEQLQAEVQSKARGTLSRAQVQADTSRISEIYRRNGRYDVRVEPKIIDQPNNRVDLVFEITEGPKTGVKVIEFIGNQAYSSYRLKDVIKTRRSNFLSFLGGNDVYDPDRIEADRDILRRFYLKNGYADVQIIAALTEYDPERKGFIVSFKIEEGQQYRVGSVDFQSSIANLDGNSFRSLSRVSVGSIYNAEAVEKSVEEMTIEASRARLCVRDGETARRPQFRSAHRFHHLCCGRGTAHLHRAHQRARQYAYP